MSYEVFLTFLAAITILTMSPGVDTMVIIRNSARGGWRDGLVTSTAICMGLFVHATVSAVGIAVILAQTAWAFNALKMAGAAYLIWLGLTSLRAAMSNQAGFKLGEFQQGNDFRFGRSVKEGFLSNVLNPKTVVFYMAFLPQFIDPEGNALTQSLLLAGIHFTIAMLWQGGIVLLVDRARGWLQKPRVSRAFDGLTGTVLTALGARLALTD
ncbi:MAG: LysE family translocator [Marinobacterium sp.]|nr:LysE family translocator [Marinobacterium sp.]